MEKTYLFKEKREVLDRICTDIMLKIGLSPALCGFRFIKYGTMFMLENEGSRTCMVSTIYNKAAEEFNTKAVNVEHSMRQAITSLFRNDVSSKINSILQNRVFDESYNHSTNSDFLALLYEITLQVYWKHTMKGTPLEEFVV